MLNKNIMVVGTEEMVKFNYEFWMLLRQCHWIMNNMHYHEFDKNDFTIIFKLFYDKALQLELVPPHCECD